MRKASGPPDRKKCRAFDVNVSILKSGEQFVIKHVTKDTKVSDLKFKTELGTGIPSQLQRLHYLDEGEMMDHQTLRFFGIVPGALIKMKLWNEWNTLIEAVAKNDTENVLSLGVTPNSDYKTAMSEYMTPQNKTKWFAERAFVALFVATHRGHQSLCQKLISSGADVNGKTASGRCPLHIAAVLGHEGVLGELLTGGADMELKDKDGNTALDLAKLNGHKNCHRQLIRFEWLKRSKNSAPPTNHPLFAHQYFDSSLKTYLHGDRAQMYCQQILPPGEFEGTGLGAPRRKEVLPGSKKLYATSPVASELCTKETDYNVSGELESVEMQIFSTKKSEIGRLAISSYTENVNVGPKHNKSKSVNAVKQFTKRTNIKSCPTKTNSTDGTTNGGLLNHREASETGDLPEAVDSGGMELQSWREDESKFGSCLSGDLIDNVIAKKLQEQHEKGIRSLPYDLWLASRDNTELYQAVRDRGQLDVMLER